GRRNGRGPGGGRPDRRGAQTSHGRRRCAAIPSRAAPGGYTWRAGLWGSIRGNMEPTDTSRSDYFHRVVDCQWACPAHTDVPEYIRLIAQGEFTAASMVNRESNVFPGIFGRVCDRPCEPPCRRGRVDETPAANRRQKRDAV